MLPFSAKLIPVLLVTSSLVLPAVFRVDTWPWSTYPMFAFNVDIDSLWIYRIHLRSKVDGAETLLPLSLRNREWEMLSKHLTAGNRRFVHRLLEAEAFNWPKELSSYSHLVLYRARKRKGDESFTGLDMEKIWEFPIEMR